MKNFEYSGNETNKISFPLGGIGTGSIGLSGNGRFIDMEIGNRPNKGSNSGFTHFAIKVEDDEKVLDARVMNSDREPDFIGQFDRPKYQGFGFGPDRADMTGVPHFKSSKFIGEFPIAKIEFLDDEFPGNLSMTAFNPFIPTNEEDSSIPGAFFEMSVTNNQVKELTYSIGLSCNNFYGNMSKDNCEHSLIEKDDYKLLHMTNDGNKNSTSYGDMTMVCDAADMSDQKYWYRGSWFDNLTTYWQDFAAYGPIKDRVYHEKKEVTVEYSADDIATLVARVKLKPGETKKVRFVLSWSKPLMSNHWELSNRLYLDEDEKRAIRSKSWKNYYATRFESSLESALYGISNFESLLKETKAFKDALFDSSMPEVVIDAISANMSILKSPTCLRLTDGSFYGFEGVHPHEGSCEGTCTHVWSYSYALAFLFPRLERSARTLEYKHSMQETGGMAFRIQLPIGGESSVFRPCVDGQYGTVMRVYREFKVSGDVEWLRSIWAQVKKSIDFAWSDDNVDKWDNDKDGVIEGRQHHTLDMELFGPNSWLTSMYLGGLKAGAELAKVIGDLEKYEEYLSVFNSGVEKLNKELYNGEYFTQKVDLNNKDELTKYSNDPMKSLFNQDVVEAYWNVEQEEIKYQIDQGCSIDQVLGQWHADLLNLGKIIDKDKVKSSLKSIYKYNYKETMYNHFNPCRIYSLNDEGGLIMCAYPEDKPKPFISVPYAEETMHGFEYQAASHMIKRGLEEEGLRCIQSIRSKYDGERRNPWNEYECGSNYARSMASYALLLVYSGFRFDMNEKMIGFDPIKYGASEKLTFFWSLDPGWGTVVMKEGHVVIALSYGEVELSRVELPFLKDKQLKSVFVDDCKISAVKLGGNFEFGSTIKLAINSTLKIAYTY